MALFRNPEEYFSSHMTRARNPREGDDREDRRGAVRTGGVGRWFFSRSGRQPSRLPNEEQGWRLRDEAFLYASSGEAVVSGRGNWDERLSKEHYRVHTRIGADPGDAEKRRESKQGAARPGRAPQDHHGVVAMRTRRHVPKKEKENTGRLKEGVTKKIKARA